MANSTHQTLKVLGKKEFSESPAMIRAIKQKGNFKALLYNDLTDELEIWSQDLLKREMTVPLSLGGDQLLGLIPQPNSVLFYTKREIGFFRLANGKIAKGRCESKMLDIEDVQMD